VAKFLTYRAYLIVIRFTGMEEMVFSKKISTVQWTANALAVTFMSTDYWMSNLCQLKT